VATIWFIFHDFPGPRPNSMTFQAWKIWILNSMTFQDLYAPCISVKQVGHVFLHAARLRDENREQKDKPQSIDGKHSTTASSSHFGMLAGSMHPVHKQENMLVLSADTICCHPTSCRTAPSCLLCQAATVN